MAAITQDYVDEYHPSKAAARPNFELHQLLDKVALATSVSAYQATQTSGVIDPGHGAVGTASVASKHERDSSNFSRHATGRGGRQAGGDDPMRSLSRRC